MRDGKFMKTEEKVTKPNLIWPVIWVTIFVSFVLLDLYFKVFRIDDEIFKILSIGNHSFKIAVLENGNSLIVKYLKYLGIILNLVYVLKRSPKDLFLVIAITFTLIADTIFALNPTSAWAVLVFCFVQYFHSLRFAKSKKLSVVRAVFTILVLIFGFASSLSNIYAFAYVYTFLIVGNIHLSYRNLDRVCREKNSSEKYKRLCAYAFAGFILFFFCDVNIALTFYSNSGILPASFGPYINFIAWLFYYPSQILLINSSLKDQA